MAKKHSASACESVDFGQVLIDMRSPNEEVRARAVRDVCPCRMGWTTFERCMQIVTQLQKDPSPLVRAAALHVIEESYELAGGGLATNPRAVTNDMLATRLRTRWKSEEDEIVPSKREKAWRHRDRSV